jgi:hypothetical protein
MPHTGKAMIDSPGFDDDQGSSTLCELSRAGR